MTRPIRAATLVHAARMLRRRPAFAGFALALVTVGAAAATAILAVAHATLLRPLPYRQPEALHDLAVDLRQSARVAQRSAISARELVAWRGASRTLAAVGGYAPTTVAVTGNGSAEAVAGMLVSAGLFELVGASPQLGREFRRDEEVATSAVAVISERLWATRFARDPAVLQRTLMVDNEARQIVGVMPARFSLFFQPADVWLPMVLSADRLRGPVRTFSAVGRLRPGVSAAQLATDLAQLEATLVQEEPDVYRGATPVATPLREALLGNQRATISILLVAVLLLVGIGAMNVAGLSAADAVAQQTTTMMRLALGAHPVHVMSLRVAEGAVLALLALPPALAGAALLLAAARALNPGLIVGPEALADLPVIAYAVGAVAVMGVLTMLPAALADARLEIASLAGAASKATGTRRERASRDVILGAQVAITVVLLVAATLLTRNLGALLDRWPGFEQRGVVVAPLAPSRAARETVQDRARRVERILAEVQQVPGVAHAATIQTRFVLNENMQSAIDIDGRPAEAGSQLTANIRHVSPAIFAVLKTRLVAGRTFDETDREGARVVAVVNESFARQLLAGAPPLGARIRRANRADAPWMDIVGVVEDVADAGAGVALGPTLYVSYLQQNTPTARVTVVARTPGDPAALADPVRRAIWRADPDQAIESTLPLEALVARSVAEPRLRAMLVGLFGASGLLLVLTGVHATTQHAVVRRTREIGIRSALGATPRSLLVDTLVGSVRPAIIGLGAGVVLAVPTVAGLQAYVREPVRPSDAPVVLLVVIVFVVLALIAAWLPARHAIRISPTIAMRA